MTYRADITGLRAVAVISVILFHGGLEFFSGGFVGVDIFFVISGYLITMLLVEDIENNRFSILNFYVKRARRIVPALFVMTLVTIPFAWIFLSDAALNKYGNGLIGISAFVSNFVFWRSQGYFDESSELNPILHTWSLGVEGQFYFIFPIFLFLIWPFGKKNVIALLFVIFFASLLFSEGVRSNSPSANFYMVVTRAWELLAGALAAFRLQKSGPQNKGFLALIGFLAILYSVVNFDQNTPAPSLYTLIPVLGTVLLVLYAGKETVVAKLLSTNFFVSIGLASYSAYLWHQPIFAFYRIYTSTISLNAAEMAMLCFLTCVVSYFSWRFIESAFRGANSTSRFSIFAFCFTGFVAIATMGFLSKKVVADGELRLAKSLSQEKFVYFENLDERKFMAGRLFYSLRPAETVVVGSSRVMQINSQITGEEILNFGVSGASIEDDIALGLEALSRIKYKKIFLAADPWLINLNDGQNRYESIGYLLDHWINLMASNKKPSSYFDSQKHLIREQSDESVFVSLRNYMSGYVKSIPLNGEVEAIAKKSYDGSHIYNHEFAYQSKDVKQSLKGLFKYAMFDFKYDDQSIQLLQQFIEYLKGNGVIVNLILVPYHPVAYQAMADQKPIFLEIEQWFKDFGERNELAIFGSYDPDVAGCGEEEFYDAGHPKGSCMQKILRAAEM